MKIINQILLFLSLPVIILNLLGGLISGIWLLCLGEWRLFLIGIFFYFFSHYVLLVFMLPAFLFSLISLSLNNNSFLKHIFIFFSNSFINLIIMFWCLGVFLICINFYEGEYRFGLCPYLLWSWGMALGPWIFLTSKESNLYSSFLIYVLSVLYFLFILSIIIGPPIPIVVLSLSFFVLCILLPLLAVKLFDSPIPLNSDISEVIDLYDKINGKDITSERLFFMLKESKFIYDFSDIKYEVLVDIDKWQSLSLEKKEKFCRICYQYFKHQCPFAQMDSLIIVGYDKEKNQSQIEIFCGAGLEQYPILHEWICPH